MTAGSGVSSWEPKPWRDVIILSTLAVLTMIPIPLGGAISGNDIIIPGLFAFTLVDVAVRSKTLDYFFPGRGNLQAVFVSLFFFAILLSYARKPALPTSLLGVDSDMAGLKLYWRYFCCFLVYLTTIYWINRNRVPPSQVFSAYFVVSLVMTGLGILMVFTGLKLPGLHGHIWEVSSTSVGATRLPFLGVFAQLGFLLELSEARGKSKYRRWFLLLFAIGLVLSGGRAVLFSTIAALIVWFVLNRRFLLTGIGAGMVVLLVFSAQLLQEIAPSAQLQQLARVGDSLEQDSVARSFVFKGLVDEIAENPVFGTGFGKSYDTGLVVIRGKFVRADFVDKQLRSGSHSTHLQLLKNLGIVGYLPFILIWLYPVYRLLPVAMSTSRDYPAELSRCSRFCIVLTAAFLIRWAFEGNGSTTSAYVFAALFSTLVTHAIYHQSLRHAETLGLKKLTRARLSS